MRAFQHRDFRLLWFGAFLSFIGSWIQRVGEGWLVYYLTHDVAKLSFITFCSSAPVAILGPFGGSFADALDKKLVLNVCQVLFGLGAAFLGVVTMMGKVQYWELVAVALLFGVVGAFEGPTRQSVVGKVVPIEDMAQAVPLNAMTFNAARVIGPAIGSVLLAALAQLFSHRFGPTFGAGVCYMLNGLSYIALIFAVLAIRSSLRPTRREAQPVVDLITEGMRYTFRDARFRTLFMMEVIASSCGMFYIAAMPAYTAENLHMGSGAGPLGMAYTVVGIGGITGILMLTVLADKPIKSLMVRFGMVLMGTGIFCLGLVNTPWIAYPLFAVIGASVLIQFNTTNTLFQLLSPDRLRGRVLAMHQWAIGGIGPFGTLLFGWFAQTSKTHQALNWFGYRFAMPPGGLSLALKIGGACILLGALWGAARIRTIAKDSWELINQSS